MLTGPLVPVGPELAGRSQPIQSDVIGEVLADRGSVMPLHNRIAGEPYASAATTTVSA
jgi:hypothetical protein